MSGEGRVGRVEVEGTSCFGGCCWETTEGVAIGVHMEPISDTVVERVGWAEEAVSVCMWRREGGRVNH